MKRCNTLVCTERNFLSKKLVNRDYLQCFNVRSIYHATHMILRLGISNVDYIWDSNKDVSIIKMLISPFWAKIPD